MAICFNCKRTFDPTSVRRSLAARYCAGVYDDYCPDANLCQECIEPDIGADWAAGGEVLDMLDEWD